MTCLGVFHYTRYSAIYFTIMHYLVLIFAIPFLNYFTIIPLPVLKNIIPLLLILIVFLSFVRTPGVGWAGQKSASEIPPYKINYIWYESDWCKLNIFYLFI